MLITSEMIDDSSTITSIVESLMEIIGSSVLQSNSKYDVIGKLNIYIFNIFYCQTSTNIVLFMKMVSHQCP